MLLSKKRPDKLVALIVLASVIIIAIVALVLSMEIAKAQTQPGRPTLTTFSYGDAFNNGISVTTWRDGKTQCTVASKSQPGDGLGVSCVVVS